jgi:hypothetical protein
MEMPELVELLQDFGVDPALTKPAYAVVRSQGTILADHSFNLVGACQIEPHELFIGARAAMLPGHWRPDVGPRSGDEVNAELAGGKPITWKFNSNEKRFSLTLPREFGGRTYHLQLIGGYTLSPLPAPWGAAAWWLPTLSFCWPERPAW